jgi:hypothetical protein
MQYPVSLMHGHGLFKIQPEYLQIGTAVLIFFHRTGLMMEMLLKLHWT